MPEFSKSLRKVLNSPVTPVLLLQVEKYEKDEKIVHGTLTSKVKSQAGEGRKDYFDTLHLSPIKVGLGTARSSTPCTYLCLQ